MLTGFVRFFFFGGAGGRGGNGGGQCLLGSQFPGQGLNVGHRQRKPGILITRPPGNFLWNF